MVLPGGQSLAVRSRGSRGRGRCAANGWCSPSGVRGAAPVSTSIWPGSRVAVCVTAAASRRCGRAGRPGHSLDDKINKTSPLCTAHERGRETESYQQAARPTFTDVSGPVPGVRRRGPVIGPGRVLAAGAPRVSGPSWVRSAGGSAASPGRGPGVSGRSGHPRRLPPDAERCDR
jgi:hypothetical protein